MQNKRNVSARLRLRRDFFQNRFKKRNTSALFSDYNIFDYYQDRRDEWGATEPDDELYPEVKDMNKIYEMVSLHGVIVYDEAYYGKRIISLFYDCTWDEEEGMGIRIALGNNVSEVKVVKIGNIGYVY